MWLLAAAIYASFKWITFVDAIASGLRPAPGRSIAYLAGWPGMDAQAFLGGASRPAAVSWSECAAAVSKTLFGAALVWGGVRLAAPYGALATGSTGLVGLIFLLHFGAFHVLSVAWRAVGIDAAPIMRSPLSATSVSDLWGRRWNLAFHVLARDLVVKPLRPRIGIPAATFLAFTFSGLIHDLVISIPAGGGYGLPTAYFLVQGAALLLERSSAGRTLRLRGGWTGRIFAIIVVAGPAFWLFHPAFVQTVVLPFLRVIGAL
jgi:alginate O-acetyltransferase complex protein AlgI